MNDLEDIHCVRDAGFRPLQTATISECRYRWLRVQDLNLLACADRGWCL